MIETFVESSLDNNGGIATVLGVTPQQFPSPSSHGLARQKSDIPFVPFYRLMLAPGL